MSNEVEIPCESDCPNREHHSNADTVKDIHRMVQEMHELVTQAAVAVEKIQNTPGGPMAMAMRMMTGKGK
jgi:hypothetical protein